MNGVKHALGVELAKAISQNGSLFELENFVKSYENRFLRDAESKVSILYRVLAKRYIRDDLFGKAGLAISRARELAGQNNLRLLCKILLTECDFHHYQAQSVDAYTCLEQIRRLLVGKNDLPILAEVGYKSGRLLHYDRRYKESIDELQLAANQFQLQEDVTGELRCRTLICHNLMEIEDIDANAYENSFLRAKSLSAITQSWASAINLEVVALRWELRNGNVSQDSLKRIENLVNSVRTASSIDTYGLANLLKLRADLCIELGLNERACADLRESINHIAAIRHREGNSKLYSKQFDEAKMMIQDYCTNFN